MKMDLQPPDSQFPYSFLNSGLRRRTNMRGIFYRFLSSSSASSRPSAARSLLMTLFFSSSAFRRIMSLFLKTSVCRFNVLLKFSTEAFLSLAMIHLSSKKRSVGYGRHESDNCITLQGQPICVNLTRFFNQCIPFCGFNLHSDYSLNENVL
nr:uncharacterized protein LOC104648070 [Solanum lycopersicum]